MIATDGMRTVIDLQTRRPLGGSGVSARQLSFGGNASTNLHDIVGNDEDQALDALVARYEPGVRTFDTAPVYRYGLGELRGRSARGARAGSGWHKEVRS